jgi:photosystem II stability/assembly factor-like uncharacterized protein
MQARRLWFGFPVLRWGVVTAAVALVLVAIGIRFRNHAATERAEATAAGASSQERRQAEPTNAVHAPEAAGKDKEISGWVAVLQSNSRKTIGAKATAMTIPSPWSVSTDGKLIRKGEDGSVEPVNVAENVRFSAVTAIRHDVWAGGDRGTLYHSSDSGATWSLVPLPFSQDIQNVTFKTSREGAISTADGVRYVTHDAGHTWNKVQ